LLAVAVAVPIMVEAVVQVGTEPIWLEQHLVAEHQQKDQ
jgi:hypothetical protein